MCGLASQLSSARRSQGAPWSIKAWLFLQIMHAVTFMCLQE